MSLSPEEKRYFGQLFKSADSERLGVITGEVAVKFFEKSGLPAATLGQIWEISDKDNSGFLTQQSFSVALRLIGQAQSGRTPEASLAKSAGPFPKFDGIDAPGAVTSPRVAAPQPPKARSVVSPLSPEDRAKYFNTWLSVSPSSDLLDGERARNVFQKANLPIEQLGQIWALTDTRQRGALDSTEFIVAMHLIQSMMNGSIKSLPSSLPPGVFEAAAKGPSARVQRQQSSVSSVRSQEPITQQFSGQRQPVPMRSQLTGPPARSSPMLEQAPSVPQMQPQMSGQVSAVEWDVKPHEKANYDNLFSDIDKSGKGYITGEEAVGFFMQSKLPEEDLAHVWDLADMDNTGRLTKEFFAVAMHLIKAKLGGKDLPAVLPVSLIPPARRSKVQAPTAVHSADAQAQAPAQPQVSSAAADLFGLNDSFSAPPPSNSPPAQAFTDNYGGIDRVASPAASDLASLRMPQNKPTSAPARGFGGQAAFVPSSSFGQSIQQQQQQQQQQPQQIQAPPPNAQQQFQSSRQVEHDLLSDADPSDFRNVSADSTELANLNNQMGSLTTQHQQIKQERGQTEADVGNLRNQKADLTSRLAQIRQAYDEEVRVVRAMQADQTKLRSETRELTKEVSLLEASLDAVKQQHGQISTQFESDRTENLAIKDRIKSANEQTNLLKATFEKVQRDAKQQRGLVAINTKQLNTLEAEHEKLNSQIEEEAKAAAEHKALLVEQEKQRAEREQKIAALEQERIRANEEQRLSALVSPAPSNASVSTNPFHRTSTPAASGQQQQRGVYSPFPAATGSSSGPAFPFVKAAVAGAALAGIGSAAASTAFGHQDGSQEHGREQTREEHRPSPIDIDDFSSSYDTAPTTADSNMPRSSNLSGFDHAFEPAPDANRSGAVEQPPPFSEKQTSEGTSKDTAPAEFQTFERNAPDFDNESTLAVHGGQGIHAPQPISGQAQKWSDADPFTADARVASPSLQDTSRPMPAAVANLALPSNASDNGSVATSVQAQAPASIRETNLESRPMTPASMTWNSDVPNDQAGPAETTSATREHELSSPTDAEKVQATLTNPPKDELQSTTEAAEASRAISSPVSGSFPDESSQIPGAFPSADSQDISEQPRSTFLTSQDHVASTTHHTPDDRSRDFLNSSSGSVTQHTSNDTGHSHDILPVSTEAAEIDSSDDEDIEQPRGADMFVQSSGAQIPTSVEERDFETASQRTITDEPTAQFSAPDSHASASNGFFGTSYGDLLPTRGNPVDSDHSEQITHADGPVAAASKEIDEFDEFDDLEEATEADEDDELNTSYTTQDFEPTFDAPSTRSSFVAPAQTQSQAFNSQSVHLQNPRENVVQASPIRDFSDFSHYSSVLGEPQGLAPAIGRDHPFSATTESSNQTTSADRYKGSQSSPFTNFGAALSSTPTSTSAPAPAPAPPASRHGASLAPKRPEPARAISAADDPMLLELMDMGFDRAKSVAALEKYNYDLGAAMDWLLKGN